MVESQLDFNFNSLKHEENLRDIMECSICMETFREPMVLSCLHTFCMVCLQELATKQDKSPGDEMQCPLCRKKFHIPEQGFEKLTRNYFVENLIESKNALKSTTVTDFCEACEGESSGMERSDRLPSADFFCTDCQLSLCRDCQQHHSKSKLFKHHKVMSKDENFQKCSDNRILPGYCTKHFPKPLDIYCSRCKDAVCVTCFVQDHKSHEGEQVGSIVDDFQEKIKTNVDSLVTFVPRLQQKKKQLDEDKTAFIEKLKILEIEIVRTREGLKAILDVQSNSLLEQLKSRGEESLKKMETCADDIDTLITGLQNFQSYCWRLMSMGSDSSICRAIDSLDRRASELQELCTKETETVFEFSRIWLRKAFRFETPETLDKNIIGELEGSIDYSLGPKCAFDFGSNVTDDNSANRDRSPSPFRSVSTGKAVFNFPGKGKGSKIAPVAVTNLSSRIVMGMAVLGNEFFAVVKVKSIVVRVHDLKNLKQKRRWSSELLVEVKDIKGSEQNKSLFIMNDTDDENEILRFDPNGTLLAFWLVKDAFGQLTITPESNILFTAWNKDQLHEYSAEGELMRVIPLTWNYELSHPWHAIKLDPESYLLSHGEPDDRLKRICIIDPDGKILKSIAKVGDADQFNCPVYMEKDRDGNVVVVDSGLRRLMVFSPKLEQINVTLYASADLAPQRVIVDDYYKRVFVVERHLGNSNDDLSVFPIERNP